MPWLRRHAALSVAFSWLMALQLLLHGVLMLPAVGGGGNALGVICTLQGPKRLPTSSGGAGSQLPPCCSSGYCCCMPGLATLPPVPTIPRVAPGPREPFRPIHIAVHVSPRGWHWRSRAPPTLS